MLKKFIGLLLLLLSAPCYSSEDTAPGGYKCFSNAYVTQIVTEQTGYVAVRFVSSTNSSEMYWIFIDPTLGVDNGKAVLSTAMTAKNMGALVDVVYWGTDTGVSHYFHAYPTPFTALRRVHTLYYN